MSEDNKAEGCILYGMALIALGFIHLSRHLFRWQAI